MLHFKVLDEALETAAFVTCSFMEENSTNKIICDSSSCFLSGVERSSISKRLEMYYIHRESNPCFPLYGVCLYLGVSVMRFHCSYIYKSLLTQFIHVHVHVHTL